MWEEYLLSAKIPYKRKALDEFWAIYRVSIPLMYYKLMIDTLYIAQNSTSAFVTNKQRGNMRFNQFICLYCIFYYFMWSPYWRFGLINK